MSEQEVWNELGNLYLLNGEYQQAEHAYNRSIRIDEAFGRPYSNLALAYVQQGKFDLAIDLYRRSIELLTENAEKAISWNRLGNVYRYLKQYKQAVVAYRNADELDPESGQGREQPGWLSEPGPAESRAEHLARSEAGDVEFEPVTSSVEIPTSVMHSQRQDAGQGSTSTWARMGQTRHRQDTSGPLEPGSLTTWEDPNVETDDPYGNWPPDAEREIYLPDADGDLTRWLPVPEEPPADELEYFPEEGFLCDDAERPSDESMALVGIPPAKGRASVTPGPTDASRGAAAALDVVVQDRRGSKFVLAPDKTGAAGQPEKDPGPSGSAPEPVRDEGQTSAPPHARAQDADEAKEIEAGLARFKRVVEVNPKNARAWDSLGNLHKSAGNYKEALLAYQQAIEHDPSRALFHHHLGLVYASEGRIEEAIDAFKRVIEIDPNHGLAHAALGGYYRKMGLEELAQTHVGIAMKSIFDSENEYNRACLAAICGNTDQALDLLRVALKNKQTYVDWILRDPDLDFIRQDPRFKQLVSDYAH